MFDLRIFLRVSANDAHARQIFLRPCRDVREKLLYLLKTDVNLLTENIDGQTDERHRYQHQKRELDGKAQKNRNHDAEGENRLKTVKNHRSDNLPDRRQIVRRPRHQIADAVVREKFERLVNQRGVKILTHIIFDMS